MKKIGLIVLLSMTVLLVSCGVTEVTKYVNEDVEKIPYIDADLSQLDTLTMASDTFDLISVVSGDIPAISYVGQCKLNVEQKIEGKFEITKTENVYKLIPESGSLKMKFEGPGTKTYKDAMKESFSKMYNFTDQQWLNILNNREEKFVFKKVIEKYIRVNSETMKFGFIVIL